MKKLLVANRGEIAVRIMRSARAAGWRTVAVYSEADRRAMHVAQADEAYEIGPAAALKSYLDIKKLIEVIQRCDATAVHPGYGFLSENADFAEAVEATSAKFVGPSAAAIRAMGSKIEAKRTVAAAGTPVVPGYQGDDQSEDLLLEEARGVGFPLLIKASAGGGGKGMRLVEEESQFVSQLAGAKREAASAFGDDRVLLEKYLGAPKHIEVQILADAHGNTLHLFERDCSVQRRHQKVIEEAPGPTVDAALRARLGEAAVRAAQSIGYVGAGTVEFIAEGGEFYFMEMNTRLQVEHPVTELVTGVDLVAWQLRICEGEVLTLQQEDLAVSGHAVEARVYAENPRKRFLPSTGQLTHVDFCDSVRVDTGVRSGDEVTMHYDPMLAKLIAHGASRAEAIARLRSALAGSTVLGVKHNIGYLVRALESAAFANGDYTTGFAESEHESLTRQDDVPFLVAAALARVGERQEGAWENADGFGLNLSPGAKVDLILEKNAHTVVLAQDYAEVDGERCRFGLLHHDAEAVSFYLQDVRVDAAVFARADGVSISIAGNSEFFPSRRASVDAFSVSTLAKGSVVSPLPGSVLAMHVETGQKVREGDALAVVEAMKMEHTVRAPSAGVVQAVFFEAGARVEEGSVLVEIS